MSSTAAAGGLRPARPDQHYEPPLGGQAIPGAKAIVRAREVIVSGSGPNFGIFVYSPSVGLGNLIASITAAAGTDAVGNATVGGFTSYRNIGGTFYAYQVGLAATPTLGISIFSAATAAGPYNNQAVAVDYDPSIPQFFNSNVSWLFQNAPLILQQSGGQELLSLIGFAVAALPYIHVNTFTAGETAYGSRVSGDTNDRLILGPDGTMTWGTGAAAGQTVLSPANLAGLLLTVTRNNFSALELTNTIGNGGQSLLQLVGALTTDRAVGIQVTGDTGNRVRVDQTPAIKLGSGTGNPDVTIARNGSGNLAMDYAQYSNNGGTPEAWQVPAFSNGWANAGTGAALQYRRVVAPYNSVQYVGRITAPVGIVAGQLITTSPPLAYHPVNIQDIGAIDITTGATVRIQVGTGGALAYESGAAAGDVITITAGLYSLDA